MDRRVISVIVRDLAAAREAGDKGRVDDLERELERVESGRVERAVI